MNEPLAQGLRTALCPVNVCMLCVALAINIIPVSVGACSFTAGIIEEQHCWCFVLEGLADR